jgi:hypothetical protein
MARLALVLFAMVLSCGSSTPAACSGRLGEVGNCFSNVTVDAPATCGLQAPGKMTGAVCDRLCSTGAHFCTWDGAVTVRCEYCAM